MQSQEDLAPAFTALLALGGQVGLPVLVLTSLRSKKLNRHSTFINFCVILILYSLIFCILIYSGKFRNLNPDHGLCVAQASMIMAILPAVIVAALMVVLQTWATFQDPGSAIFTASKKSWMTFILLASPYFTFLGYLLGSIVVVTSSPDSVWADNGLYCFFKPTVTWYYLGPFSCLVLLAVTGVLEFVVVIQWYRRWYRMKKAFPLADRKAQILICFRACLFSVYTWLAFVASISFRGNGTPTGSYLSEAGLPLVAFLVFGTQKDILDAWGIRRAAPQETSAATPDQQQATSPVSTASEDSAFSGPQEP